jgi:hypothetical protein
LYNSIEMSTCKPIAIPEISNVIIIPKTSPTMKKESFFVQEYSLKEDNFDPSKNSPPNFFMSKLQQRMSIYNSYTFSSIKEDNFNNE